MASANDMDNHEKTWLWDYFQWTKIFDAKQIKEINETIESFYNEKENPKDGTDWKNVSNVKKIYYGRIRHLIQHFVEDAYNVAEFDFGYNVFNHRDLRQCNFNIYDSKDKADYGWHTDYCFLPAVDCKLTLLINLSEEPYEGGEFQILNTNKEQTIEPFGNPGSAFMFKSHILHRVLPVKSGVRKSLALFIHGPRFQ